MMFRNVSALAALGLALTGSAGAAGFTIFIYESPSELARRTNADQCYWEAYIRFAGELAQAGVLRGGSSLAERRPTLSRGREGSSQAVAGAQLGGYFVIEAADLPAAQAWAQKVPRAALAVEIAEHRANPTMSGKAPVAARNPSNHN